MVETRARPAHPGASASEDPLTGRCPEPRARGPLRGPTCGARRGHGAVPARPARCERPHTRGTAQSPVFPARRGFSRSRLAVSSPCSGWCPGSPLTPRARVSSCAARHPWQPSTPAWGAARRLCPERVRGCDGRGFFRDVDPNRHRQRAWICPWVRSAPCACTGDVLRKAAAHLLGRVLWSDRRVRGSSRRTAWGRRDWWPLSVHPARGSARQPHLFLLLRRPCARAPSPAACGSSGSRVQADTRTQIGSRGWFWCVGAPVFARPSCARTRTGFHSQRASVRSGPVSGSRGLRAISSSTAGLQPRRGCAFPGQGLSASSPCASSSPQEALPSRPTVLCPAGGTSAAVRSGAASAPSSCSTASGPGSVVRGPSWPVEEGPSPHAAPSPRSRMFPRNVSVAFVPSRSTGSALSSRLPAGVRVFLLARACHDFAHVTLPSAFNALAARGGF